MPSFYGFDPERVLAAPLLDVDSAQTVQFDQTGIAWFRINLQTGQAYELFTADLSEGLDTSLAIFNCTGDEGAFDEDIDATRCIVIRPFYFRSNDTRYSVEVEEVPLIARDAFEPDDQPANAGLLVEGEAQLRTIQDSSDVHLVQVQVQAGKA